MNAPSLHPTRLLMRDFVLELQVRELLGEEEVDLNALEQLLGFSPA